MTWYTLGDAGWLRGFVSESLYDGDITGIATTTYPDGEWRIDLNAMPGSCNVIAACTIDPRTNRVDMSVFWALLAAAEAARQHGASAIVALVPEVPCLRQDRPTAQTSELAVRDWVVQLLRSSAVDALITLHPKPDFGAALHNCTVIAPPPEKIAQAVAVQMRRQGIVVDRIVSPDEGSRPFATAFAEVFSCPQENLAKKRVSADNVAHFPVGNGRPTADGSRLIVDDMYVSGGTLLSAAAMVGQFEPFYGYISNFRPTPLGRQRLSRLRSMPNFRGLFVPAYGAPRYRSLDIFDVKVTSIMDPLVAQAQQYADLGWAVSP